MGGLTPEKTPFENSMVTVDSTTTVFVLVLALSLAGLFIAALYLKSVALVLSPPEEEADSLAARIFGLFTSVAIAWLRLLALGIFLLTTLFIILLPLLPVAYVLSLISQGLAIVALLVAVVVVVAYLSMSVPAIVHDQLPVGFSVVSSVRIVRKYMLQVMRLLMLVVVIGWGTNLLWRIADSGNWLTLFSIAGHGFISTALVSSIFIFYRDRSTFVQSGQGI